MPLLNTSKNGVTKIYNVEVTLSTGVKVREEIELKGFEESDIIVNGSSFKKSIFNVKNKQGHVVTNFIRQSNYRKNKQDFLVTTKKYADSIFYDLYHVEMPPVKVTEGLDNLYGQVIMDLQKQVPGHKKGRYVRLKELGVDNHITEDKILQLKAIVEKASNKTELDFLMQANNLSTLPATLDFIHLFDFRIISEATVKESQITELLNSFQFIHTRDTKNLQNYYRIAEENREVYKKLTYMNKIIYGQPLNLIQPREKSKTLVKTNDSPKERDYEKQAA